MWATPTQLRTRPVHPTLLGTSIPGGRRGNKGARSPPPPIGQPRRGACKAHLKHDSSERVGGVSGRPAWAQRRSDPSSRVLAAGGGRHLGSLGKRHPSRGGAGRGASSGLLVASLSFQAASRQSCQRPGCPETAKEGNLRRPSPCDGNHAAPDSFGATFQVTGPSLGPPTFAPCAGH